MNSILIKWLGISLIIVGVLGFVVVGWRANEQSQPLVITASHDAATVLFEAERGAVLLPGGCLTVQWQAEGIAGIYFERNGVGGVDTRQACIISTTYKPSLRVDFSDGSSGLYQLDVAILLYDWLLWSILAAGVLAILMGVRLLPFVPLQWRRRIFSMGQLLLFGALSLVLTLYLFAPNPLVIQSLEGGTEIYFVTSRQWLLQPDGCVLASWDIRGMQEAHIENRPMREPGITSTNENSHLCTQSPRHLVISTQNTVVVYDLPGLIYWQIEFWMLIICGLLFIRQLSPVFFVSPAINEVKYVLRLSVKVGVLLAIFMAAYVTFQPIDTLADWVGWISIKHPHLWEHSGIEYTDWRLVNHVISRPKAEDEFRVVVLGDSSIFGSVFPNEDTLTGQLNSLQLVAPDGRHLQFYNLAYPAPSFMFQYMLLQQALRFEPDMVLWSVPYQGFQFTPIHHRSILRQYGIESAADLQDYCTSTVWEQRTPATILTHRRELRTLLEEPLRGVMRLLISVDPALADSPIDQNFTIHNLIGMYSENAVAVFAECLDNLDMPVLVVNEPVYRFSLDEAGVHYTVEDAEMYFNQFYERASYVEYQATLAQYAENADWAYVDLYDAVTNIEFADALHYSVEGTRQYFEALTPRIIIVVNGDSIEP